MSLKLSEEKELRHLVAEGKPSASWTTVHLKRLPRKAWSESIRQKGKSRLIGKFIFATCSQTSVVTFISMCTFTSVYKRSKGSFSLFYFEVSFFRALFYYSAPHTAPSHNAPTAFLDKRGRASRPPFTESG